MKYLTALFILVLCAVSLQAQQERYLLVLGQDTISITTGRQYVYVTRDGRELPIELIKQKIQTYESRLIRFQYPSKFELSTTDLGQGIEQVTVLTEDGAGFFIQQYFDSEPDDVVNLMMAELTKEAIQSGYDAREETFEKILRDGKLLLGRKRTLTYRGKVETYTVASFSAKNQGILAVMVTNNTGNQKENQDLIQLLLESLEIKVN